MKKGILSCLKMNLCMYKEGWCVALGQEGSCLHEGGGNYLKYLKKGGIEKREGETKILTREGASWVKW